MPARHGVRTVQPSPASLTPLRRSPACEAYTDWIKGLLGPIPDGHYELKAFAVDEDRGTVVAVAVFHGTHTGEGGPVPPTGKTVAADYAYVMQFKGSRIAHMSKIWNADHSLKALGLGVIDTLAELSQV